VLSGRVRTIYDPFRRADATGASCARRSPTTIPRNRVDPVA
jgi:hypothetical protein